MEAFYIFILCSYFPHQWRDLTNYKLSILQTSCQFSSFCQFSYDRALREHTQQQESSPTGAQVRTRPASANLVTSQAEVSGSTTTKVIWYSWKAGLLHRSQSELSILPCMYSCTSLHLTRPHSPDPKEPKHQKHH